MPEISRFYGISIYMFYKEHNPPHIHVEYQGYKGKIEIKSGRVIGKLPMKVQSLVKEWIEKNIREITFNWNQSVEKKQLLKIKPLD